MPGALAWGSGGEIHSTPSAVAHTAFWRAMLRKPHHRRCQPCAAACRSGGGARGLRTATSRRTSCRHSECHRPPTSAPSTKRRLGAPAKQLWIAAVFARSGGKQGCPIVSCSLAGGLATSGERGN